MASLTCGTAAGDPHKSPPANPAGHSVPRVCVAGGNGPEAPGWARPGVSEAAEGRFLAQLYSCTARRVLCPFFGGIRLLFGELDALTPPDCSGAVGKVLCEAPKSNLMPAKNGHSKSRYSSRPTVYPVIKIKACFKTQNGKVNFDAISSPPKCTCTCMIDPMLSLQCRAVRMVPWCRL